MTQESSVRARVSRGICAVAAMGLALGAAGARWTGTSQTKIDLGGTPGMGYGNAVAIDGDRAIVGSWVTGQDGSGGTGGALSNRAAVLARQGGTWVEESVLFPDPMNDSSAYAGAVAIDGDVAVVAGSWQGYVDVFERTGGTWSLQTQLTPTDPENLSEVMQIALDGPTLVLSTLSGGVYVFARSGSQWAQEAKIVIPAPDDNSTHSIAIAGDTIAVGTTYQQSGKVHVFVRSSGQWSEQAALESDDGDALQGSVALSGDRLLSGGSGGPHLFERRGSVWTQEVYFVSGNYAAGGRTGVIAGDTVVVPELVYRPGNSGTLYSAVAVLYRREEMGWAKQDVILVGDALSGWQDPAVALSGDTLIMGLRQADPELAGAVYAVDLGPSSEGGGCSAGGRPWGSRGAPLLAAAVIALAVARRRRAVGR